jgi:CBS domain-containing protein
MDPWSTPAANPGYASWLDFPFFRTKPAGASSNDVFLGGAAAQPRVGNPVKETLMLRAYPTLPLRGVPAGAGFCAPEQPMPERVEIDAPALAVMTDLTRISAVLIRPTDAMEEAVSRMKQRGVRLLLVVDGERRVMGLITANDVLGERPMRHLSQHGGRRSDILVGNVMTPREDLEAIAMTTVQTSKVGHIVATLHRTGRQHALAVEADGRIRGIFSATQIARQLGVDPQSINPLEIAHTFAQIEATLAH